MPPNLQEQMLWYAAAPVIAGAADSQLRRSLVSEDPAENEKFSASPRIYNHDHL